MKELLLLRLLKTFAKNTVDQVIQGDFILLCFQDKCAEFQEQMKNGRLSCTRESDPVRDADGKSYNNKCTMCKAKL